MKKLAFLILFLTGIQVFAQNSLIFYTFPEVPQSSLLNPAYRIPCKLYLSLPGIGSTHLDLGSTGFSYNNIVTSTNYDIDYLVSHAHGMDYMNLEAHLNLLSVGMEYRHMFFSLQISNKLNAFLGYPKNLLDVVWNGNSSFIGKTANLSRLALDINDYYEIAAGVSWEYDYNLHFGANAKVLFGLANTSTSASSIRLNTDSDTYALNLNTAIHQNASFPLIIGTDPSTGFVNSLGLGELNPLSMLTNFSNVGFAFDIGTVYDFDRQIRLSASLVDVGFIRYSKDVHNFNQQGNLQLNSIADPTALDNVLIDLRDSYGASYSQNTYFYFLPLQTYLNAEYRPTEFAEIGIVNRNQLLRKKLKSSVALYTTLKPNKNLSFMLSYGVINNGFTNIGAGLMYKVSIVQLHLMANNVVGLIYPYGARNANLRFGINLLFGCKEKPKKAPESMEGCYKSKYRR